MFVKQEVAMKKAAIVMGSDSDLGKVRSAALTLKELGIPFEMRIISAHRTPAEAADFAQNAEKNGFGVLIAAAGKAAHLAGALAANTVLPVIGAADQLFHAGRAGRAALDGADALGDAGGHGGDRRRAQRGAFSGADALAVRRRAARKAACPAGE